VNTHPNGQEYFVDLEVASDMATGLVVRNALTEAGNKFKSNGFPEPTDWVLVFLKTNPTDNNGWAIDGATFMDVVDDDGVKRCNIIIKKNQSEQKLKSTAAHELFHCVQNHYPLRVFPNDAWLYESTAVWAEEFVYPTGNTEHEYDRLIFPTFQKHIFDVSNDRNYGSYLFWFYLYQKAGKHPSPIRKALTDATRPNTQKTALEARPNFKNELREYALWNLNAEPFVYYQDADGEPTLMPQPPALEKQTITSSLVMPQDLEMEPGGINYYAYKIESSVDRLKVNLEQANNKVFPDIAVQMIYKIDENWIYMDVSSENEVVFCRKRPSERVTRLILIFDNPNLDESYIGKIEVDGTEACAPEWGGYIRAYWTDNGSKTDLPTLSGDEVYGSWQERGSFTIRDILVYDREKDEFLIKNTFFSYSFTESQNITYARSCGLLYESDSHVLHGGGTKEWDIDEKNLWLSNAPERFESADEGPGVYTFTLDPPVGVFISHSESITERNTCPFWGITTPVPPEYDLDVWDSTYNSETSYIPVADPNIDEIRVVLSEDGKRLTGIGNGYLLYDSREIPVIVDIDYSYR
jgi:hypothetical protein